MEIEHVVHDLKCWPVFFTDIVSGRKAFEIRNNDRGYHIGDYLFLREWYPTSDSYSGRIAMVKVVTVLGHDDVMIDHLQLVPEGIVVMGIQLLDSQGVTRILS